MKTEEKVVGIFKNLHELWIATDRGGHEIVGAYRTRVECYDVFEELCNDIKHLDKLEGDIVIGYVASYGGKILILFPGKRDNLIDQPVGSSAYGLV